MQDEPAPTRLPVRPRWVVSQPGDVPPRLATVVAPEQPGGFNACVEAPRTRRNTPDSLDRCFSRLVRQTLARMRPRCAHIGRLPDGRAEPFVAAAAIDRPRSRIGDDVVHRPCLAERTAKLPRTPLGIAFNDERALLRSDQDEDFPRHVGLPLLR